MAYVIVVENDGSLYGSHKEQIIQREKLVNKIWFLVPPYYNEYDMSKCTVTLRYFLPISKEYKTEILELSKEGYEEYLKYVLPIDTILSKEHGEIEFNLTFTFVDIDDNGNIIQHVRKTTNGYIKITPIPNWDAFIPDGSLMALDQRILKQDAQQMAQAMQIEELNNMIEVLNEKKVDNLVYDKKEDAIHLSANGTVVGDKVSVREMLDDGVPIVDLNADSENDSDKEHGNNCDCGCDCDDNVVEFGYLPDTSKPTIEDSDIVEF